MRQLFFPQENDLKITRLLHDPGYQRYERIRVGSELRRIPEKIFKALEANAFERYLSPSIVDEIGKFL